MTSTKEEIMDAVHTVLIQHGASELSIGNIADQADLGKSLVYYHYENKKELLAAFLQHLITEMQRCMDPVDELDPKEELRNFIDTGLCLDSKDTWKLRTALMEMRAQASHSDLLAGKFNKIDQFILDRLQTLLTTLKADNPDKLARISYTAIEGTMYKQLTAPDQDEREQLREDILSILSEHLPDSSLD